MRDAYDSRRRQSLRRTAERKFVLQRVVGTGLHSGLVLLDPMAMAELMAVAAGQSVVSEGAARGISVPRGRSAARAERLAAYDSLATAALSARLRIETLSSAHHNNLNPLHIPAQVTGYPLVVGQLERLGEDLCALAERWRQVRRVAPPAVIEGANELVAAVLAFCTVTEAPYWHPRKRAQRKIAFAAADNRWTKACTAYELLSLADGGSSRSIRRRSIAEFGDRE